MAILLWIVGSLTGLSAQPLLYNGGEVLLVQKNTVLHVEGGVRVADGLGTPGRIALQGQLNVAGDWENESSGQVFESNDLGQVHLVGDSGITLIGGPHATKFPELWLDRPGSGRIVQLEQDGWAWHRLDLGDDVLDMGNHDFSLIGSTADALGRSEGVAPPYLVVAGGGYLRGSGGTFVRQVQASGDSPTYLFPLASNNRWYPLTIAPQASGATWYGVRFLELPAPNGGARDSSLQAINPEWYHEIERWGAPSGPERIRVYFDGDLDEVCDPEAATLAQFEDFQWRGLPITAGNAGGPYLGYLEAQMDSIPSVAWPLALAARTSPPEASPCVFPPDLIVLSAEAGSDRIDLHWETDSEQAGDYFELERSRDGQSFETLYRTNANLLPLPPHQYDFSDQTPAPQQRYFYRVRQVDQNGEVRLSNTVEAILLGEEGLYIGEFFPNPTSRLTSIVLGSREAIRVDWTVVNPLGQIVMETQYELEAGSTRLDFAPGSLAKGVFLVKIRANRQQYLRRVVVN